MGPPPPPAVVKRRPMSPTLAASTLPRRRDYRCNCHAAGAAAATPALLEACRFFYCGNPALDGFLNVN